MSFTLTVIPVKNIKSVELAVWKIAPDEERIIWSGKEIVKILNTGTAGFQLSPYTMFMIS